MNKLQICLQNCYGIQSLDYEFDFSKGKNSIKSKSYAIYAPNGLMKSSFAKTFEAISKGSSPKEERYNRPSRCTVKADNIDLPKEAIYVLKSEIDITTNSPAITNILVNPEHKAQYDELLVDLDKYKNKLIISLQKQSKVRKNDIEKSILNDFGITNLSDCIEHIQTLDITDNLENFEYSTIFDPKVVDVYNSPLFESNANEFNKRYQELFEKSGTIYQKGVFNPAKAETSFTTLKKQGFFEGGHKVHLKGDEQSLDKEELEQKLQKIHKSIDSDENLKQLRLNLAKNAQTQSLTELIESLTPMDIELLLEKIMSKNQSQFRKELWAYYIQNNKDATIYTELYKNSKDKLLEIEKAAAKGAPRWTKAVELFNNRFIDMPFTLVVANQVEAALGKEKAELQFIFEDGEDTVKCSRAEIKTLSQGEKRALYLLNFIFEVEVRKLENQYTLFIIDDVADSFDYKNKHAILQYLRDLCNTENFYQIILTHNFDFFRSLTNSFVQYDRCLMANKSINSITLSKTEGIKNYFIGKWKNKVTNCDNILCATIPFTRNLIEYTKGDSDKDYLILTSLLHWKSNTDSITVGDYLDIYNRLFNTDYDNINSRLVKDLLFEKATEICQSSTIDGLNLEVKVLLSIAIRLKTEIYLTNKVRLLKKDANYWCQSKNQFGKLINQFTELDPSSPAISILEKISITVSSNIHLNSFMYEPIIDLNIEHLIDLYQEVQTLSS